MLFVVEIEVDEDIEITDRLRERDVLLIVTADVEEGDLLDPDTLAGNCFSK